MADEKRIAFIMKSRSTNNFTAQDQFQRGHLGESCQRIRKVSVGDATAGGNDGEDHRRALLLLNIRSLARSGSVCM